MSCLEHSERMLGSRENLLDGARREKANQLLTIQAAWQRLSHGKFFRVPCHSAQYSVHKPPPSVIAQGGPVTAEELSSGAPVALKAGLYGGIFV